MIGQKLSHYRILEQLDRDDISETYLANDTEARRQVFLKIVPIHICRDPGRLNHIREDVEAAAEVSHPHLAKTFSFEQGTTEDGLSVQFISTEYVRGKRLSEMIPAEGFDLADILPWLENLADALACAHRAGVLHRDLRPSNIVITPEGEPIIVGLGMARLVRPDLDLSTGKTPTRSIDVIRTLLQRGSRLDAIAYMAPEQAEGRMPSPGSDVFSFGTIMYELFTGNRPFDGETYVELVSRILRDSIDLITAQRPELPYIMGRTVAMCLQKDPQFRYQSMDQVLESIGEIRKEFQPRQVIEERFASEAEAKLQPRSAFGRFRARRYTLPAACLLAGSLITYGVISYFGDRAAPPDPGEVGLKKLPISILLPSFGVNGDEKQEPSHSVLSPDGRKILYTYDNRLWLHDLSNVKPVAIENTQDGEAVFWKPDSRAIGFFSMDPSVKRWTMRRIDLDNTGYATLCTLPNDASPYGAAWRASGDIVYSASDPGSGVENLYVVPEQGGEARTLLAPDTGQGEKGYRFPAANGDGLLFSVRSVEETGKILYFDGKKSEPLVVHPCERIAHPVFAPQGYVVYQRESGGRRSVYAVSFGRSKPPGTPFAVDENGEYPSMANDGTLLYYIRALSSQNQLAYVDRKGNIGDFIGQPLNVSTIPRFLPTASVWR